MSELKANTMVNVRRAMAPPQDKKKWPVVLSITTDHGEQVWKTLLIKAQAHH